jgi:mycothiol synthase
MKFDQRAFSGQDDLRAMETLARKCSASHLHTLDLPYRFSSWALDDPENIRLWTDENGHLIAWGVLQVPFDALDFVSLPEMESELLPQVLAWADKRSIAHPDMIPLGTPDDKPCWFANVFANQTIQLRILEAGGFSSQSDVDKCSWSKVFMVRPGNLPVKDYRIPKGFVVHPLKGEVEAYVNLHQATFGSKNMTTDWRRRITQHPDYIPELDLVIEAPDRRLAAFCVCWLDTHGLEPVGQIEPLGCHADFRNYALGRVVLAEGLRRLQAHGAQKVYVETDNWRNTAFRLYESMGFQVERDVLEYRKDY